MTTVLVTGGAGFIGSNIVEDLLSQDYNVRVLDNLDTGRNKNLSEFGGKIELIRGDMRDLETVKKAVNGVDYISHQGNH